MMLNTLGAIAATGFLMALVFVILRVVADPRRLRWRTPRGRRRSTLPERFFRW